MHSELVSSTDETSTSFTTAAGNSVAESKSVTPVTAAEDAAVGEQLLNRALVAVKKLDLNECLRITTWANESVHPAAGRALCSLLYKPRTWKALQAWKREPWVAMRVSAVQALRKLQDHYAAPTLAAVMMTDLPPVRAEASIALQALERHAVLPIVERIRSSSDWPLDGMLCSMDTLGLIKDETAGPTLARVLFGLIPTTPTRWLGLHIKWAAGLGALGTGLVSIYLIRSAPDFAPIYLYLAASVMMFMMFSVLGAVGISVFIRRAKTNESNRLNAAAANALMSIKDARSVPSLIEVATEKYLQSARNGAVLALREVLPVLDAEDFGLLTGQVERRLTQLFASNNPSLLLAIVRALEFVGTGQSAGPVERLARRKVSASDSLSVLIHSEAERVLPILLERKRMEEASSVLLRPSQGSDDRSDILLRPVTSLSSYEEHTEQLLRPSDQ